MTSLEMQLVICKEIITNVEKGDLNGKNLIEQIRSGEYINGLSCEKSDPDMFKEASKIIKDGMLEGFEDELKRTNFVMRNLILVARFGMPGVNKNFITGLDKWIHEIEEEIAKNEVTKEEVTKDEVTKDEIKIEDSKSTPHNAIARTNSQYNFSTNINNVEKPISAPVMELIH